MRVFLKNAAALALAVLALAGSEMAILRLSNLAAPPYTDPGMYLAYQNGQVVVAYVDTGSPAQADGVVAGKVVAQFNGRDVLDASIGEKQDLVNAHPPTYWVWLIDADQIRDAMDLMAGTYTGGDFVGEQVTLNDEVRYQPPVDVGPMCLGLALLLGGWWLLRTGRAGERLRRYRLTLPVAVAMPLLLTGLDQYQSGYTAGAETMLYLAGPLPLALDFAAEIPALRGRVLSRLGVLAVCLVILGGMTIWLGSYWLYRAPVTTLYDLGYYDGGIVSWRYVFVALISLGPGLLAAGPTGLGWMLRGRRPWTTWPLLGASPDVGEAAAGGGLFESTDLALAAITPAISGVTLLGLDHEVWPIVVWLVGIFAVRRFQAPALERLQRLASRTTRQRDLVVTATERERARIAGDIHDYALQDLTMLVRRLDASGDVENAAAAREVADRLRAICGDLRLPILDDLGVGPALDWLVDRLEPDNGKLDLELLDGEKRLAPDAELAFFRVAQEAIANSIHHGAPPILVRYWGGGDWAELIVDDCGAGIPAGAAEAAERTGHMGLMSMSQRAEAIGAELTFGRRPGGGARVHMTWERKADSAGGATERSAESSGPAEAAPEPA